MPVENLLIVGPRGHGGINRYIEDQQRHLEDELDVATYGHTTPEGRGLSKTLRDVGRTVLALSLFPFQGRPDVVHVHTSHRFSFLRASWYVFVAAIVWNRPVVLHVHGSSFDEFVADRTGPMAWLQTVVFDLADAVIVLGPYWRETLADLVSQDRLHVVPNAVELEKYRVDPGADPPHVVFLSSLIDRKGIPTFLEAVETLLSPPAPDVRVSVAGTGRYADRVTSWAEDFEEVTYHGYVSESDKHELLSTGSIYVLPTHAEGLPIAILEAMAAGNAIVSTGVGDIPEVVDTDGGLLVDPGDADGLATVLRELVADPARVERMGRHNRELIAARYSWARTVERLLALYEEVATDSEGGGSTRSAEPVEVERSPAASGSGIESR